MRLRELGDGAVVGDVSGDVVMAKVHATTSAYTPSNSNAAATFALDEEIALSCVAPDTCSKRCRSRSGDGWQGGCEHRDKVTTCYFTGGSCPAAHTGLEELEQQSWSTCSMCGAQAAVSERGPRASRDTAHTFQASYAYQVVSGRHSLSTSLFKASNSNSNNRCWRQTVLSQ